ncbi:MAG: hypothetical protein GPJ54_15695 [Candidatus Heimdallarchaeota archaeon]|nr:hypothetical protein [Candidatus Heimdallarchaeota archaeon]
MVFNVHKGDHDIKQKLQSLLHERGSEETGLEDFLTDLEETESIEGAWWVVMDSSNIPRGALTVRYMNELSYLRSVWTRVNQVEDAQSASKALLSQWLETPQDNTKKFQADLPFFSPLISSLMETGFKKEKILLSSYELTTDWYAEELPDDYSMRPVEHDELSMIYDTLVKIDLDPASPIYITKEAFIEFGAQLPESAKSSWVGVQDNHGKLVGFAASFLSLVKDEPNAVLYGPHSNEPKILRCLIGETLTFWKSKGINNIRILRVSEFHPSIENYFKMKLSHETIRYSVNRSK